MSAALSPSQRVSLVRAVSEAPEPMGVDQLALVANASVELIRAFTDQALRVGLLQRAGVMRGRTALRAAAGAESVLGPLRPDRPNRTHSYTTLDLLRLSINELSACLRSKKDTSKTWKKAIIQSEIYRRAAAKALWTLAIHGDLAAVKERERSIRALTKQIDTLVERGQRRFNVHAEGKVSNAVPIDVVADPRASKAIAAAVRGLSVGKGPLLSNPLVPLVPLRPEGPGFPRRPVGRLGSAESLADQRLVALLPGKGGLANDALGLITRHLKRHGEWFSSHHLRTIEDPMILVLNATDQGGTLAERLTRRMHKRDWPIARIDIGAMQEEDRTDLFRSVAKFCAIGNAFVVITVDSSIGSTRREQIAKATKRLTVPGAWVLEEESARTLIFGSVILPVQDDAEDHTKRKLGFHYGQDLVMGTFSVHKDAHVRTQRHQVFVIDASRRDAVDELASIPAVTFLSAPSDDQLDDMLEAFPVP